LKAPCGGLGATGRSLAISSIVLARGRRHWRDAPQSAIVRA
jgi:hypothetical protein